MKNLIIPLMALFLLIPIVATAQENPPPVQSIDSCCIELWRECMGEFEEPDYCDIQYFCCIENSSPEVSQWSTMPYAASNFSADFATWAVTDANEEVRFVKLESKTMIVNIAVNTSLLSGGMSATKLKVLIPAGGISRKVHNTSAILRNTAFLQLAQFRVNAGGTHILITTVPFRTYNIGDVEVRGQIVIELQ